MSRSPVCWALMIAVVLPTAAGCSPKQSDAAPAASATAARQGEYQPTAVDKYYWECFCAAWQEGKGQKDAGAFSSLPSPDITDPLLISMHNEWADFLGTWRDLKDRRGSDMEEAVAMMKQRTAVHLTAYYAISKDTQKARDRYGPAGQE